MFYGKIFSLGTTGSSGVAGAIQFSNGSAFSSDATNLFYDDTNNRLGIGTNAPIAILQVQNSTSGVLLARFKDAFAATSFIDIKQDSTLTDYTGLYWSNEYKMLSRSGGTTFINISSNVVFADGLLAKTTITPTEFQIGAISGARLGIKGSGSTSATTSLLVQNSAGTAAMTVKDDLSTTFGSSINANYINMQFTGIYNSEYFSLASGVSSLGSSGLYVGSGGLLSSAIIQANSTTQGFLPPRMTTTQKNAIATPAAGLMVYDSTTNKLCCYNGTTWNDLF